MFSFLNVASIAIAVSSQAGQSFSPDETAIRAGILAVESGWNAGSGEKFAAPFAEDADYVVVNGMLIKGKKGIAAGHDFIFKGIYKGSINKATIKSVRFVRPDVAISHVEWNLKFDKGEGRAMNTMTWVKTKDQWEIVAFQNTNVAPN